MNGEAGDPRVLHLSPSIAAVLLSRSPLHAWQQHSMGGNKRPETTDPMRAGKLIDRLLFRTGPEVVIVDADSWRTNAAKAARDEAEARGAIAVLKEKHDEADRVANDIRASLFDRGINLNDAQCQVRTVWNSDGVPCKGFLDARIDGMATGSYLGPFIDVYDLKVTDNAAPSALKLDLRARLQWAAYLEAEETLHPECAGRVRVRFIFAETTGELTIAEPDGQLQALAKAQWRRAVATWGECLRLGKWPGFSREVARLDCKPWEFDAELAAVVPAGGSPGVDF